MKKIILSFPTNELMAEFLIACKIKGGDINTRDNTITGTFDERSVEIAFTQFQASFPQAPDFIITT